MGRDDAAKPLDPSGFVFREAGRRHGSVRQQR